MSTNWGYKEGAKLAREMGGMAKGGRVGVKAHSRAPRVAKPPMPMPPAPTAPMPDMSQMPAPMPQGMRCGGKVKGYAKGGKVAAPKAPPKATPPSKDIPQARGMKKGGKFEGSAKDEAQDKKLAKKHGMSMKKWESSAMDVKHDRQESAKGMAKGGKLTAARRQALPKSSFALPGNGKGPKGAGAGSYPIPDASHARNALARVSQHGSSAEKAAVRAKVHAKYPGIGKK